MSEPPGGPETPELTLTYTVSRALERRLRRDYLFRQAPGYPSALGLFTIFAVLLSYARDTVWLGGLCCGLAAAGWLALWRPRRKSKSDARQVRVRIAADRLYMDSEGVGSFVEWSHVRKLTAGDAFIYLYARERRDWGLSLPRSAVPDAALRLIEERVAAGRPSPPAAAAGGG